MNVEQNDLDSLDSDLDDIGEEASAFFKRMRDAASQSAREKPWNYPDSREMTTELVSKQDHEEFLPAFTARIVQTVSKIIEVSKTSSLVDDVDRRKLRRSLREMLAALRFKTYTEWDAHIEHDEDRVVNVAPAGQEENACSVSDARNGFYDGLRKVAGILKLVYPTDVSLASAIARSDVNPVKRYRPNTAFIMMWITEKDPQLEDVKNCFKAVFKQFGIEAVRSDEIEHSGVITDRILDEIASSEFLIADLTGERPSVYYEVGYAHALGKRPILYRRKGTPLHFDLALHNCPEYENISDLTEKLTARLTAITNKEPGK